MNREIKIRAWDKKNKKMVTHFQLNYTSEKNYKKWNFLSSNFDYCNINKVDMIPSQDDLVFMQYTGLKDKNGKEVYEGDIWRDDLGDVYVVTKENYYDSDYNNYIYGYCFNGGSNHGEVIGNIYEDKNSLN